MEGIPGAYCPAFVVMMRGCDVSGLLKLPELLTLSFRLSFGVLKLVVLLRECESSSQPAQ